MNKKIINSDSASAYGLELTEDATECPEAYLTNRLIPKNQPAKIPLLF